MEGQIQSCPSLIQSRQIPPQASRVSFASLFRTQHQPYPWLSQLLSLLVGVLFLRLVALQELPLCPHPVHRDRCAEPPLQNPNWCCLCDSFRLPSCPGWVRSVLTLYSALHCPRCNYTIVSLLVHCSSMGLNRNSVRGIDLAYFLAAQGPGKEQAFSKYF